ncbi:MAG: branched-chain amino acid ABC transporter substrate-binding protein, partial [Methylovulum sp.]
MNRFIQIVINVLVISQLLGAIVVHAKPQQTVNIAYLAQEQNAPPALSNLDPLIKDKGLVGAELAISDNNTTGQFTGQQFVLKKFILPADANVADAFTKNIAGKFPYVVAMLAAEQLIQIADLPAAKQMLIFDAASSDDALRNEQCRNNVLHILPSRAMRADALGQYLVKKRWTKWFLVVGPAPE